MLDTATYNERAKKDAERWIAGGAKFVKYDIFYDGWHEVDYVRIVKPCKSYVKCKTDSGQELRIKYDRIVDYVW